MSREESGLRIRADQMEVYLIGFGPGDIGFLTLEAERIIKNSHIILGTKRAVTEIREKIFNLSLKETGGFPEDTHEAVIEKERSSFKEEQRLVCVRTYTEEALSELIELRKEEGDKRACVVYSGDTGFYSGASLLYELLRGEGFSPVILPGISSLQYFSAALCENWQDFTLLSTHGRKADVLKAVCKGKPVFLLTSGVKDGEKILHELSLAGLSGESAALGYMLSFKDGSDPGDEAGDIPYKEPPEKIIRGTIADLEGYLSELKEGPLVLLIYPPKDIIKRTPGIEDEEFIRGSRPMTKQNIRTLVLSKLKACERDTALDIGAGTGSVSIELSMVCGRVYALEKEEEGIRLLNLNRKKFGAYNLHIVKGRAPEALSLSPFRDSDGEGPVFTKIFIGGSDKSLVRIIETVDSMYAEKALNEGSPDFMICITAVTIETAAEATERLESLSYDTEILQISASTGKKVGSKHMMKAEDPIYIITGRKG